MHVELLCPLVPQLFRHAVKDGSVVLFRADAAQSAGIQVALCAVDRRITPCIDFGHLNARTLGGIQSRADYAAILDRMDEVLGDERARRFHVHFSRIEFSAGGEKRHWTFAETQFGPEPQPLMELLAERRLEPVVICESAGTQAEDAQAMQRMYEAARG